MSKKLLRPEPNSTKGSTCSLYLGVYMRNNFVAKHCRTYNKAQIFTDRKKASKYKWDLEDELEPPFMF